jgi:DNA-binding Xre family transcriptional regulator
MVHIGKEIKNKAKELRIGPTELAKKINVSKQNVYHIFERKSVDTDQLDMISKALDFNFFDLYINENTVLEPQNEKQSKEKYLQDELMKSKDALIEQLQENLRMMKEKLDQYEGKEKKVG